MCHWDKVFAHSNGHQYWKRLKHDANSSSLKMVAIFERFLHIVMGLIEKQMLNFWQKM